MPYIGTDTVRSFNLHLIVRQMQPKCNQNITLRNVYVCQTADGTLISDQSYKGAVRVRSHHA